MTIYEGWKEGSRASTKTMRYTDYVDLLDFVGKCLERAVRLEAEKENRND